MTLEIQGRTVNLDNQGYLLDPSDWTREVAKKLAEAENLELDDRRWQVIGFVRHYFEERQTVPKAHRRNGERGQFSHCGIGHDWLDSVHGEMRIDFASALYYVTFRCDRREAIYENE